MQRPAGQYDHLARLRRAQSCQSSRLKSRNSGCRAVQPCAEPRPPGTEFLDAETKRQKSSFKRANARRDQIRELSGRKSPQKRAIQRRAGNVRFAETGWWCAQSYANPSQRRFHTGNRGNPLFSAFFSQNGEFKSKGFRYPCQTRSTTPNPPYKKLPILNV